MQSLLTTNGIFHRTKTDNFTIFMETQKTPKSQSNLEKEHSWRHKLDFTLYYKTIVIKADHPLQLDDIYYKSF